MTQISPLDPAKANGPVKMTMDAIRQRIGFVPIFYGTMVKAPPALDAYLKASGAFSHGHFSATLRERLALAVAQANNYAYCLSAHTAVGKMVGLDQAAINVSRRGHADAPPDAAVLLLAIKLVQTRGHLDDGDLADARQAGLSDSDILETSAHVAMNIFSNYVNQFAAPDIDFPKIDPTVFD